MRSAEPLNRCEQTRLHKLFLHNMLVLNQEGWYYPTLLFDKYANLSHDKGQISIYIRFPFLINQTDGKIGVIDALK